MLVEHTDTICFTILNVILCSERQALANKF